MTTLPVFKVPMHLCYLLYLAKFSRLAARAYLRFALAMCRLTGTQPSILLHPLDFMGREDCPQLAFFPGMDLPRERKLALASDLLGDAREPLRDRDDGGARGARYRREPLPEHHGATRRVWMRARRSILIVGLLLGAAFLAYAARALDPRALLELLRTTHPGLFSAALVCALAFSMVKAWRWRYLLQPLAQVPARALLSPVFIGGAANALIPHSGELVRASVVGRRYALPASALLGSIVVERVFDFVAVLVLAAIVFATTRHVSDDLVTASYALAGVSALARRRRGTFRVADGALPAHRVLLHDAAYLALEGRPVAPFSRGIRRASPRFAGRACS